jgi:penicillin-binding protein activator
VVIVGEFRNRTMEHIPVATFVRDLERAYVNSGVVRVVAGGDERQDVRGERRDQQEHAVRTRGRAWRRRRAPATCCRAASKAIEDREGPGARDLLPDRRHAHRPAVQRAVWVGQHKIKKVITQPRFRR